MAQLASKKARQSASESGSQPPTAKSKDSAAHKPSQNPAMKIVSNDRAYVSQSSISETSKRSEHRFISRSGKFAKNIHKRIETTGEKQS